MGKDKPSHSKFERLRRRAEKYLNEMGDPETPAGSDDPIRLLHELQTHQIELELQNVELQNSQQELLESQNRYLDLYDFAPVGYFAVSDKGLIEEANITLAEMLGTERRFLSGRPVTVFIAPDDQANYYRFRRMLLGSETRRSCELSMRRKDGTTFHVHLEGVVLPELDGKRGRFRVAITDISERKRAEVEKSKYGEAILRINQDLEERVAERSAKLIEASEALKRSTDLVRETQDKLILSERMAMLGEVVAGTTHEIDTPLGIGITTVSHLAEKTKATLERYRQGKMARSDLEKYLLLMDESTGILDANLKQSAELVRSLKVVAVDQCSNDRRRFGLKAYLAEIITSLGPRLAKSTHSLVIDCPENIELNSYPGAFAQILTNLTMNALQHAFANMENGEIRISVHEEKERIRILFSDNGKGIEAEHLDRIFDAFFTTKRTDGGSGLGTSIVYNLVKERLQGQITCRSTGKDGTTFDITLPKELPSP